MALALNSSHVLASAVAALIAVDPASGSLVDLKRPAVTFTKDAGCTIGTTAQGVGTITTGGTSAEARQGFSWSVPITGVSNVAGFAGTVLLVSKYLRGDPNLPDYKVAYPIAGTGELVYAPMPAIAQGKGHVAMLSPTIGTNYDASLTSGASQAGAVHSIAVTQSNVEGGWNNVAGRMFIDGVDTNVTCNGNAGTYNISGVNLAANQLWVGEVHYLVFFNRVLTTEEIAALHAGVASNGRLPLVTGYAAAPVEPVAPGAPGFASPSTTDTTATVTITGAGTLKYRVNGGAWVMSSTGVVTLTGLTPSTEYTVDATATFSGLTSVVTTVKLVTQAATPVVEEPVTPVSPTAEKLKAYEYDGTNWVEKSVVIAVDTTTNHIIAFYKL